MWKRLICNIFFFMKLNLLRKSQVIFNEIDQKKWGRLVLRTEKWNKKINTRTLWFQERLRNFLLNSQLLSLRISAILIKNEKKKNKISRILDIRKKIQHFIASRFFCINLMIYLKHFMKNCLHITFIFLGNLIKFLCRKSISFNPSCSIKLFLRSS